MTYALDVSRLVGIPFDSQALGVDGGANCLTLTREVLARNGRPQAAQLLPATPAEYLRTASKVIRGELAEFENVGSRPEHATELCDVLLGEGDGGGLHVEILVSIRPRLTLTIRKGHFSRLQRPSKFEGCTDVLRSAS